MKGKNIVRTKYGMASRIGDDILIHKDIPKESMLYKKLLIHELEHSEGYSFRDFLLDVDVKELKGLKLDYWKFVLKHPSSWVMFLPITKYKKEWILDINLLGFWLFAGVIAWIMTYVIF